MASLHFPVNGIVSFLFCFLIWGFKNPEPLENKDHVDDCKDSDSGMSLGSPSRVGESVAPWGLELPMHQAEKISMTQ